MKAKHLIYSTCVQNLTNLALAVPDISLGARKYKMGHVTLNTLHLRVIRPPYAGT